MLVLLEGTVILAGFAGLMLLAPPAAGIAGVVWLSLHSAGLALCVMAAFYFTDIYGARTLWDFQVLLSRLPKTFCLLVALLTGFHTLAPATQIAGSALQSSLIVSIAIVFGLMLPVRLGIREITRGSRKPRLLIVGSSPLARQLVREIESRNGSGYALTALPELTRSGSLIWDSSAFHRAVEESQPDRIVVAVEDRRGQLPIERLLNARVYQGVPIDDGVSTYERLTGKLAIESLAPSHVIFEDAFSHTRLSLIARRLVSIVVALVGLVITAPILAIVALVIRLDSPGPVFFAQRRIGFRGRAFTLLKFRTMHPVPQPVSEWAKDNKQRITRAGRWLRRLWLDELPQLINVLRGDMDLVGPRPHPLSNFEMFVLVSRNTPRCGVPIPLYALRCLVRPGVTGWAQVRYGYANDLDEEIEKLRYDLYYIKHRSLWLDLRILLETLKMILAPRDGDSSRSPHVRPKHLVDAGDLPHGGQRVGPSGLMVNLSVLERDTGSR